MGRMMIALIFVLLTAACGKEMGAVSQIKDSPEPGSVPLNSHITLLYWDNKNMGFGHVTTEIFVGEDSKPTYYVSYAMGNDYNVDLAKHGKEPVRMVLPTRSYEQFQKFETWYLASIYADIHSDRYSEQYSMLSHNCAHAALNVLRAFDYDLPIEGQAPIALRPKQVFMAARQYVNDNKTSF